MIDLPIKREILVCHNGPNLAKEGPSKLWWDPLTCNNDEGLFLKRSHLKLKGGPSSYGGPLNLSTVNLCRHIVSIYYEYENLPCFTRIMSITNTTAQYVFQQTYLRAVFGIPLQIFRTLRAYYFHLLLVNRDQRA